MTFPFTIAFVVLLLAYMVYSVWAHLDARYPIGAALVLLVATAVVDALGNTGAANALAEYVFFLLGGGVVLLLVEHVREGRAVSAPAAGSSPGRAQPDPAEAPQDRETPADQTLDGFEEEPVAVVDTPGEEYEEDEEPRQHEREYDES